MQARPEFQGCGREPKNASLRKQSSRIRQCNRNTLILGLLAMPCCYSPGARRRKRSPRPVRPRCWLPTSCSRTCPSFNEWVAQLNGPVNVDITPKVQGYLLKQDYQNGYFVKEGQLLFELDPRQYQAAVEQAEAQVAVAHAKFAEVQQRMLTAILRWPRKMPFRKSSSIRTLPIRLRSRPKFLPKRRP